MSFQRVVGSRVVTSPLGRNLASRALRWDTGPGRRVGPRQLNCAQAGSHALTFFSLLSFVIFVQSTWLTSDGDLGPVPSTLFVVVFWLLFWITVSLYCFVCFADTRYLEDMRMLNGNREFEGRRCEECSPIITHTRVKHCQTCGSCIEGFDHHCRYLNVCIGGRTYKPWLVFVFGLLLEMLACCVGALAALWAPDRQAYWLFAYWPLLFFLVLGAQATLAALETVFLICLLGQHLYFVSQNMTTLEYVKDQSPGFPSLPPYGWRDAVCKGDCHRCGDPLQPIEVEDPTEIWYCSICQSDIARANLEFLSCECCENFNVCPICREIARAPAVMATTHRSSALRRRAEVVVGSTVRESSHPSRQHSASSHREARRGRSSVVASVEGHTGDPGGRRLCCGCCPPEALASRQGYDASAADDSDGSSSGGESSG